ncbi:MAG: hypothetical protein AVDCRST_MAG89-3511, partial [uncultured Gemmatimonadetes bacterium]
CVERRAAHPCRRPERAQDRAPIWARRTNLIHRSFRGTEGESAPPDGDPVAPQPLGGGAARRARDVRFRYGYSLQGHPPKRSATRTRWGPD